MNASLHLQRRCLGTVSVPKAFAALCSEAVGFGIVGCKLTAAVHFLPVFCPISRYGDCKTVKNWPSWGQFSLRRPKPDSLLGEGHTALRYQMGANIVPVAAQRVRCERNTVGHCGSGHTQSNPRMDQ